jgi:hypothetical protein
MGTWLKSLCLIIAIYSLRASGQITAEVTYTDGFGQSLVFYCDSTFEYNYYFDIIHNRAWGLWVLEDGLVKLEYFQILDTIISVDTVRYSTSEREFITPIERQTLVPSKNRKGRRIYEYSSGNIDATESSFRPAFLAIRKKGLFPTDDEGVLLWRTKIQNIWGKRARTYFKKLSQGNPK